MLVTVKCSHERRIATKVIGRMRDLVDDETPVRVDTYETYNEVCACGAVFTHARLVASEPATPEYIAAEWRRITA